MDDRKTQRIGALGELRNHLTHAEILVETVLPLFEGNVPAQLELATIKDILNRAFDGTSELTDEVIEAKEK